MKAKLSTHVLDNYHGRPAGGVAWTLERQSATEEWTSLSSGKTNQDGRTERPLLEDDALLTARYRLTFDCESYYRANEVELSAPPFLDKIAIEVNLLAGQSYHVPLLMTPWSYSTYRGS